MPKPLGFGNKGRNQTKVKKEAKTVKGKRSGTKLKWFHKDDF